MSSALVNLFNNVRSTFWSERVWLPPNTSWALYESRVTNIKYARFNDLYWSAITALVLVALRFILERTILTYIGILCGIKPRRDRPLPPAPHPDVEKEYLKSRGGRRLEHKTISALAKRIDVSERHIERWLRKRAAKDRASTMTRFTESLWRATFYAGAFFFGLWTLSDKPWLWDSMECFNNYPHHVSVFPESSIAQPSV